jgi:hypothetical protein
LVDESATRCPIVRYVGISNVPLYIETSGIKAETRSNVHSHLDPAHVATIVYAEPSFEGRVHVTPVTVISSPTLLQPEVQKQQTLFRNNIARGELHVDPKVLMLSDGELGYHLHLRSIS